MKLTQIKTSAQLLVRTRAQFLDLQFARLVSEGLAGPDYVAIDFIDDVEFLLGTVFHEIVDRLLARPVHLVHTGIHYQPYRSPHLISKLAKLCIGIVIEAHLLAQRFRIQSPPFGESSVAAITPEVWDVALFLGQRDL